MLAATLMLSRVNLYGAKPFISLVYSQELMLHRQHSCTAWRMGSNTALELLTAKPCKFGNSLASFDV